MVGRFFMALSATVVAPACWWPRPFPRLQPAPSAKAGTAGQKSQGAEGRPDRPTFLTLSATSDAKPGQPAAASAIPATAPATAVTPLAATASPAPEPVRQPVARVTEGKPVLPSGTGRSGGNTTSAPTRSA